jgi:hypothetical protein
MTQPSLDRPPAPLPPQMAVMQMATSHWVSQSIYVAAKLGIADLLAAGAKPYQELATATQTNPAALFRLLRALASLGIVSEGEPGCFAIATLGEYLRSDRADSLQAMAIMNGEEHYRAWGDLLYSVQTGENAFERIYERPIFEYLGQNPSAAETFDRAMTSYSSLEIPAIVASYDFSGIHTLVDVAGGVGSLLLAILAANPQMQGILFDLEAVIDRAKPLVAQSDAASRCQLATGDFFTSVPTGGDAYILKHIIHDWGDDAALAILTACQVAMPVGAKLLLAEQVIPPGNEPFVGKLLDLNMLVMCQGGCERTEAEYRDLLDRAGFDLTQIIPTPSFTSIVEAIRR